MAREDIKTAADLRKVIENDLPRNVIVTPVSPRAFQHLLDEGRTEAVNTEMYFRTAIRASEADAKENEPRSAKQSDYDLLKGQSGQVHRLAGLNRKAASSGKFKQVTKVRPLSEGAEA